MIGLTPLEVPATTAGTSEAAVPVYRYLMQQPGHWLRQAFFIGRPKLPISRVVEDMQENNLSIEEVAREWSLPVDAVEEAIDYFHRFRDLVEADAADELALSDELAQRRLPTS